jgi:hypothetical protein
MDVGIFRLDESFLRQIAALSNEKMANFMLSPAEAV